MGRSETWIKILTGTIVILICLVTSMEAWSGNVCSTQKTGTRKAETCTRSGWKRRCSTKYYTYFYTEYYCCDGWTETLTGNEICTKRIPLSDNRVESYNELPSLAWRSLSSNAEVIDDRTLSSGVFTAGKHFDIVTTAVDATTIGCGAKRKIWMRDTLPAADGSFHKKTVCVTDADTNNPCKDTFTIEIHNGGNFRIYALEAFSSGKDTVSYCFDLSVPRDPCSGSIPPTLPGLEFHRPSNTHTKQSDDALIGGWYSAGLYQIITSSPALDSSIRCGAKSQMWMKDSFPEVDGKHHVRKLCVTDAATSNTCLASTYYIFFIRNCGSHFVYFLTSSPKADSAYCFGINGVESYNEVPSLAWRSESSNEEIIDDRTLSSGVFTAGKYFDIVTTAVDATTIGCGAKRKIWMKDTLPDADGSFHTKTVCVTDVDTNNTCKDTFTIEVHNGGDFRIYALEALSSDQYGLGMDSVSYCFDLSIPRDPCSGSIPPALPGLASHRPSNSDIAQSDDDLIVDWYSAGPYQIATNSPALDSRIRCGAQSQIWMKDSFPEVDGNHHVRKLCITDAATSNTCIGSTHYTFIKNCGSHFVYFLTSSPKPDSAYCFDIPSESDDPAPDLMPSNVQIVPSLKWIPHGLTSLTSLTSLGLKPSLQFQCSFDTNIERDFFYVVYFYVDGNYIIGSDIVVQDSTEAYVSEQLFNLHGFSAGITISCHVGTRSSRNGRTGVIAESPGFYAGIKMMDSFVDVQRGDKGVVRFFPTVPFGCMYNQASPVTACTLTLFISEDTTDNTCESNTIQHQCAVEINGVTKEDYITGDPWTPEMSNTFEVVTAESKRGAYYLSNTRFVLKLRTEKPSHMFWQDSESEAVTVNVHEMKASEIWQGKVCQIYCDPHHLTFDGMRFELQYPGKFMLLKSEDPPMQVQVEIASCYNTGAAPYCACGLVAVVGQDIFQIYTCSGHNKIEFVECKDNVLKAERKSAKAYTIYLPTGATINVVLRGGRYYYMMDIDITPTLHEYQGQTTGLCGNLDGDRCNDCVSRGGRLPCTEPAPDSTVGLKCGGGYTYHPNDFTSSYSLTEEENLLNVNPDVTLLEPYPTSRQLCVCPKNNGAEPVCSYIQYASCDTQDDTYIRCVRRGQLSLTRRKRTVQQDTYLHKHERGKRSVVMTESEATAACSLALLASPTYTACTNMKISSSEIQTCTVDLMMTGDSNWTRYAVDRFESACLDIITKNSTLRETFPDEVNTIQSYTCPNGCSGKGSCSNGACICDEGYTSDDCSYDLTMPLAISGLEHDDLCDLRYGCDSIVIKGQDFPYGRNYTCQFTGQMIFINSSVQILVVQNVTAQYQSLFELFCDLPDIDNTPGRLGIEYNISVAMDPFDFSTAWNFVVIDTACQTFTYEEGFASFHIQAGFCFINGMCIPTGYHNKADLCQECYSQDSVYTWSESTDCADLSTGDDVFVAVTCSVVILLILVSVVVYYWKLRHIKFVKERCGSVAVMFSAKADAVGNIHFNQHHNLDQPYGLPPKDGETRGMFHKVNKTHPFPLTDKV